MRGFQPNAPTTPATLVPTSALSLRYKWGRALPSFCMDERWPDGGVGGLYPDAPGIYGELAGRPILPGCEPPSCLPQYSVDNGLGSIRAQVR